jgi:hypothetical protein
MTNASRRKPPRDEASHAAPRQVVTLAATAQDGSPQVAHCLAKGAQRRAIPGYPVNTEVTQEDRAQVCSLFRNGRVQALPEFWSTCSLRSRACISRLVTQPVRSPVNASTPPSRAAPHDSGPLWFAIPSTYETFIHNTLPVLTGARRNHVL